MCSLSDPTEILAQPLCRHVSGIFVVKNLEDFAGDFPGEFFWALFPTKMRRKNLATKSAKKSGGPKIKIHKKSVLPKTDPTEISPPCRETGVAIPLSHCFACGIADYRCYTPTSFHMKWTIAIWQTGLGRRVSQENFASEAYRAIPEDVFSTD